MVVWTSEAYKSQEMPVGVLRCFVDLEMERIQEPGQGLVSRGGRLAA